MEAKNESDVHVIGDVTPQTDEASLWRHRDEPGAREELLRRHMNFARALALKFRSGPEGTDDLIQVAYLGLVSAVGRFDPRRGIPFKAFASPTINGELKRHFRDRGSSVKIPRRLYERIGKLDTAVSELGAELRHTPSVSEIAIEMETSEYDVLEAIEAKQTRFPLSLEAPVAGDSPEITAAERIGEFDGSFNAVEDNFALTEAAAELSENEREVLRMRFREEMTQAEIAECIGHSQMHVSRILKRTLDRLRSELRAESA